MDTHDQPPREGKILPDVQPSRNYALLLQGLAATRIVFTLAVLSTFVAAVTLLVLGTIETFRTVATLLGFGEQSLSLPQVRQHYIEVVDLFLVATIMYVMSIGFYQLFADSRLPVAAWLKVQSASDLEQKLIGVAPSYVPDVAGIVSTVAVAQDLGFAPQGVDLPAYAKKFNNTSFAQSVLSKP